MIKQSIKIIFWVCLFAILIQSYLHFYEQDKVAETALLPKPEIDYWQIFAEIRKERRFIKEADAYYRIPVFTPKLERLSGKEIILIGYYLPFARSDSTIILSRYPNSSCFYCGQAGVESVAMVELNENIRQYRTDQILSVQGKLVLNSTDIEKLAFIIKDARIEVLH